MIGRSPTVATMLPTLLTGWQWGVGVWGEGGGVLWEGGGEYRVLGKSAAVNHRAVSPKV